MKPAFYLGRSLRTYAACLTLAAVSAFFYACGDHDDAAPKKEEEKMDILISSYNGSANEAEAHVRMLAEYDRAMLAEFYDPEHPDRMMYQYVPAAGSDAQTMLIVITEDNLFFIPDDAEGTGWENEVLVASSGDHFATLNRCRIDWDTMEITEMLSSVSMPALKQASVSGAGDFDSVIRKTFVDMFDEIGTNISKMGEYVEKLGPIGRSAGDVCTMWTKVVVPIAKYQLYDGDPEGQNEIFRAECENRFDELQSYIEELGNVVKVYKTANKAYTAGKYAYNLLHEYEIGSEVDESELSRIAYKGDSYAELAANQADEKSDVLSQPVEQIGGQPPVEVLCNFVEMYEENGSFYAKFRCGVIVYEGLYGNYSDMGVTYSGSDGSHDVPTNILNLTECTIGPLRPASRYRVAAYYYSLPRDFYSEFINIVTPGLEFSASPTSLSFEKEGGQQKVAVSISDAASWRVVSSPEWCTCAYPNVYSLTVSVGRASATREGSIVLRATNQARDTQDVTISVSQEVQKEQKPDEGGDNGGNSNQEVSGDPGAWSNTSWSFSGTERLAMSGISIPGAGGVGPQTVNMPRNFTITVGNAARKEFSLGGDFAGQESTFKFAELADGRLKLSYDMNLSQYAAGVAGGLKVEILIKKNGSDRATAVENGSSSMNAGGVAFSYTISATLEGRRQ